MAQEITMPKLGLTMTEGTVREWSLPDGASVRKGDIVAVIETDKVESEVEAEADGVLQHVAAAGDELAVEMVIGYVLEPGEPRVEH
jgi:pyruvate dehydrogenase E2 component (dihydrolipoamide acetyltransferase)